MSEQDDKVLSLAQAVGNRLAGGDLPPSFAKLYSQHTRLSAGRAGVRWGENETQQRLEDAVRLVDAGLVQRRADDPDWFRPMLRAAELLEWLAHPALNTDSLPIDLLAAAAYQLAGYPARAASMLSQSTAANADVGPLVALLRGDFPVLLRTLTRYWSAGVRRPMVVGDSLQKINWADDRLAAAQFRRMIDDEAASAMGIICAAMRWGTTDRVEAALDKFDSLAKLMLSGHDRYSWLLAKLTAETARTFLLTALRGALRWLPDTLDKYGALAVERYLRQAYINRRTQAWPSQLRGIERLALNTSFVLCTPTGSGKTTIAEIAILQSLFAPHATAPLVMYLVPSRALAAEVESKLSRVIAPLTQQQVVVTGLYGGIDWGPTDAWLTSEERTVLICTYEKAEALIRFLGPLFLNRLSLVVLDEAHTIQFDGELNDLRSAESRALRLEALISRMLVYIPAERSRVVALSAVAAGMENTLARWVTGNAEATPERTLYRSTRQLIGRLECRVGRAFEIRYDLLDRVSLQFGDTDSPYIPQPFPPHPPSPSFARAEKEKALRPYLFWAAMHLVAPAGSTGLHAVLISVPQQIGGYAQDLLTLLDKDWAAVARPMVFYAPTDPRKADRWKQCLRACEDYFGVTSREYQLLQKGIVVHHGKMPGLMARLLIQLVEDGVIHFIIATSTLSQGINLPFETVLVPTLRREQKSMTAQEFANLAGRAGRPGYATEGRCLVLLPENPSDGSGRTARRRYHEIIQQLTVRRGRRDPEQRGRSALASLLTALRQLWMRVSRSTDEASFLKWLEQTATVVDVSAVESESDDLLETLDALDSLLLAAIVEVESLEIATLSAAEIEARLVRVWTRCYAHFASTDEAQMGRWFVRRGLGLVQNVYPEKSRRKRLYRTGLPPRQGDLLTQIYPAVKQHLLFGRDYASRDTPGQFDFVRSLAELLSKHPKFRPSAKTPGKYDTWDTILRWWLDPTGPVQMPGATRVSEWYDYVAKNFTYKLSWGIGCILAIAADDAHGGVLKPTSLETWPTLGLPWIALWLKELITWGTLDPVAAYVLGRGRAGTRAEARERSSQYYEQYESLDADGKLNPTLIRTWAETLPRAKQESTRVAPPAPLKATLERQFPSQAARNWRVLPVEMGEHLSWVDVAGFVLASSQRPASWRSELLEHGDFTLALDEGVVKYVPYL